MTRPLTLASRVLLAASACTWAASPCLGDDSPAAILGVHSDRSFTAPLEGCDVYPIALYPDPNAEALAEAELQGFAPGATMIWHPARGTFWFVTLSVPLPQCVAQSDVYTQLLGLTQTFPDLFQLDPTEWNTPASYPCSNVGQVPQVLEIERARIGSHPIAHDLIKFTVQRVNGIVHLRALMGEYLPAATPWLDAELSACPNLDEELASQVVLDSGFVYSVFLACYPLGFGVYSPNALDAITFDPGASWAWQEDPVAPRVLFTKSSSGRLVLDPSNFTRELIQSDANCPTENGRPRIGFRLTFDTVTTEMVTYQPGLNCVVCLR